MSNDSSPASPDHFLVSIGGFHGPNLHVEGEGDSLTVRTNPKGPVEASGGEEWTLSPSEDDWKALWNAANEAGVWNWHERYATPGVMDGTQWKVEITRGPDAVDTYGDNAYPTADGELSEMQRTPAFTTFLRAVKALAGLGE